jgi:branched-chain amino acid transport system ATP-binding protein
MAEPEGGALLSVAGLVAGYGRTRALHGIDVRVGAGQIVALIGANGAGKTTLLRTISGLLRAERGRIIFADRPIGGLAPDRRFRAGIAQVPEGRQVFGPLSVEDNLMLGGYVRSAAQRREGLARIYAQFPDLLAKRALPAMTLSGGQQQMLAIGRALMGAPRLLLLDEPSMGLAPKLVGEVFETVRRLRAEGLSILLVEQNAYAALRVADVGYVLESGRIVMAGPASELLNDPRVQAAYLGM